MNSNSSRLRSLCAIATLALIFVWALAAAQAAPALASPGPASHEGQITAIAGQNLTLQLPGGTNLNLMILPQARVQVGADREAKASQLQTGLWVRVRTFTDGTGHLVTGDVRVVPKPSTTGSGSPVAPAKAAAAARKAATRASLAESSARTQTAAAPTAGVCGSTGGSSQPTGDWPMLGRDPAHGFLNLDELALQPPLPLHWQATLPNGNIWAIAGASVVGNVAYVGGSDGFHALDLEQKIERWHTVTSGSNELSTPAVSGGMVYFATWTGDVYALDAASGAVLWSRTLLPVGDLPQFYSPAVASGVVYLTVDSRTIDPVNPRVFHNQSMVFALDAASGNELWHTQAVSTTNPNSSSDPALANGLVYVGTTHEGVFALEAATGNVAWHFAMPAGASVSDINYDGYVIVQDGLVLVPFTFGRYPNTTDFLYALDAASGAVVWSYTPTSPAYPFSSGALVANHTAYQWLIKPGDSTTKVLVSVDVATGAEKWQVTYVDDGVDGGWWWQSAANGILYRTSASLFVRGFRLSDGAEVWSFQTNTSIEVPPIPAGGKLVTPDSEGNVWVFGLPAPAGSGYSICGTVYSDANLNSQRDTGEAGVAAATLHLTGVTVAGQPVDQTTTTDIAGDYSYPNLPEGTYTIVETDAYGYFSLAATPGSAGGTASDANTIAGIVLDAAHPGSTGNDFGDALYVTLLGVVYDDADLDGVRGAGEGGLDAAAITLTGTDFRGQSVSHALVADPQGDYFAGNLLPGTYNVAETNPSGYFSTTPDSVNVVAMTPGQTYASDFADARYASLSGVVYFDANLNGARDAGEAGLAGVTVTLTGTDFRGQPVSRELVTDAQGNFVANNVLPGTYTLAETDPAGYQSSSAQAGSAGGTVVDFNTINNIHLGAGVNAVNYEFGDALPPTPTPTNTATNTPTPTPTSPPLPSGEQCYIGTDNPSQVSARHSWTIDPQAQTVTIRTTFARTFVDNTYGANAIGWSKKHTFGNLTGSDHVQLALYDQANNKRMEFKLDYLTASASAPSGYKSLGVTGGDGRMILGSASDVLSAVTSLDVNFNQLGYVLTTDSPATDANYTPNSTYPNWMFEVWYEVSVKLSAFGPEGFGHPLITSVHASPSKTGNNTEPVTPTACPPSTPTGTTTPTGTSTPTPTPTPTPVGGTAPVMACVVYAVHDEGSNDSQFFTVDLSTHTASPLGPLYADYDIEGIDIHPVTRVLYATAGSDNRLGQDGYLYRVDSQTGALTSIGPTGFSEVVALSFRPTTQTLYGWSEGAGLIEINLDTGAATRVFSSPKNSEGIAWNNDGTLLYASSGKKLWVYDIANNTFSQIASNLPGTTEALEMRPDGLLMGGVHNSESVSIFAYDVNTLQLVSSQSIVTPYNDVESIAWPEFCGNPPGPARTPTQTPTPTPEPSQPGEQCYIGTNNPSQVSGRHSWTIDPQAQTVTIRTTFARTFVDNTYGANAIGWSKKHTFGNLTGSDHVQLALYDQANNKKMEFKLDYLTASASAPSGYKSLGVTGGDGRMILGSASDVLSAVTSLDVNFNQLGYVLTTDSPATDASYTPNSTYPNWMFEVWYEVSVKLSAFGPEGFGHPLITSVHASPSKTGNNTEPVTPTTCPPL